MDMDDNPRPVKRFKHQSYNASLKEVHLPSVLVRTEVTDDLGDSQSSFHEGINYWRELNLAPSFLKFAGQTSDLSISMALLLHHWREVVDFWLAAMKSADDEAYKPLLNLMQKLVADLQSTLSPTYSTILECLLGLLPRTIPAPALTELLSTFSTLFKYLLISGSASFESETSPLLVETWNAIAKTLPKCNPEVQRATAEAWGAVLRRLKGESRTKAVTSLAGGIDRVEDAAAWSIISACKSVAQTLHTSTPSIFTSLLTHHLSLPTNTDAESTHLLLRRSLIALAHHVKSAENFTPIADVIIARLNATLDGSSPLPSHALARLLEVLTTLCSVRNGGRISQAYISNLLQQYPSIPYSVSLHDSLLRFGTALLHSSQLPLWPTHARAALEYAWTCGPEDGSASLGLPLVGALSQLGWAGWRTAALPGVLRRTPELLEKLPNETLDLLVALVKDGRMMNVDVVWKQRVRVWIEKRLDGWVFSEESAMELRAIVILNSVVPVPPAKLAYVVHAILEVQSANSRASFYASPANSAAILGLCLETLAELPVDEWLPDINLGEWVTRLISGWGWSTSALGGLVKLLQANPALFPSGLSASTIYPSLHHALSSHIQVLRLNALQLLALDIIRWDGPSGDIVKKCLQGEEVALDVQGVRERVLRISRLEQALRDEDQYGAEISVRWLIGQLKVNLRPIWKPASHALAQISHRFGDIVWRLVFDNIERVSSQQEGVGLEDDPSWMNEEHDETNDGISEEEFTWRDPSAHKLLVQTGKWVNKDKMREDMISIQKHTERLDVRMFESQLLTVLATAHWLSERHNRELVPLFLSLQKPQDNGAPLSRHKLAAWLIVFSKFTNPKAVYATDRLHAFYISLLSHSDRNLQRLALSCVLTYKSAELVRQEDTLRTLLDETRWRDELTGLNLAEVAGPGRTEFIDTVIRLLFGVMLERRGRGNETDRRVAILSTLAGCTDDELGLLVELMLRPFLTAYLPSAVSSEEGFNEWDIPSGVTDKQQVGFLKLLADVIRNLGPRLVAQWPALLSTTLNLIAQAQKRIESMKKSSIGEETDADGDGEDDEDEGAEITPTKAPRTIRQLGLKRLADFFRNPAEFDFTIWMRPIFAIVVSPRLDVLDHENTQAPSALLNLFYVWSSRLKYASLLVDYDSSVLPKVYDCLVAANIKTSVVGRVFDIIEYLLVHAEADDTIANTVLRPHIHILLDRLSTVLSTTKEIASFASPLAQRQISILSKIAHYISDETQASMLLTLLLPLLRKSYKLVNEKVKGNILAIVENLLLSIPAIADDTSPIFKSTYETLSSLFQSIRSRQARLALVATFQQLALRKKVLVHLADILASLNAYSTKRVEEPDFERRLVAFSTLNETMHTSMSAHEWLPVLYNALHFIQDVNELTIRSSSALSLKLFLDRLATSSNTEFERTFHRVLNPALKNGLRTKSELVRAEILGVIAHGVKRCQNITSFQEMRSLLADGDEEADFFNNILHVQVHRRTRALRRLTQYVDEGHIRSTTLSEVFIPLVGNFISTTASDHHLVNEAITTTGHLSRHLTWGAYHALVQQHLRLLREQEGAERLQVRVIVAILDAFHFPMDAEVEDAAEPTQEDVLGKENTELSGAIQCQPLIKTRIKDAVNLRLLPTLLRHLENRKEAEDTIRIPIAVGIVKVALHLPESIREAQIQKLLTVLSQVLRSKSQETRDLARDTLCRIAVMLGPAYLNLLLGELRGALVRGPQIYVLAFTVHHIINHVTTGEHASTFIDLDPCVTNAVHVSSEVIFGEASKDIQSEDFKTKMREVRVAKSKGLDAFAILARHISPIAVSGLLLPIRSIMQETASHKVLLDVDEVLRRITSGLNANVRLVPSELLLLCHTLISRNAKFLNEAPRKSGHNGKKGHAIVQLKRKTTADADNLANNSFRFVVFGLDLLNTSFRRARFDLSDAQIVARLDPMVPVIGNVLYSDNGQVLVQAVKAATAIAKLPLKSVGKALPVFIRQILDIIGNSGSTESDIAQAALKAFATLLRDCPSAQVKEKDLVHLLELIGPDLEEPTRQAAVFATLRVIVSRRFVVPEIYDMMDKVSEVMVTNQSSQVQELCRGVLLQFLLDYPQGKGRLRNQMTFLVKNLSYVYESGRKSVMELLGAVIAKFDAALLLEYSDLLFVGFVMVLANDESPRCKEMAAALIQALIVRLDEDRRATMLSHLHSWASQRTQGRLCAVAAQVYGLVIDALHQGVVASENHIRADITALLRHSVQLLSELENEEDEYDDKSLVDWQIPYQSLVTGGKLLRELPTITTKNGPFQWSDVTALLLFPHTWVRLSASRLLGQLFAAIPIAAPDPLLEDKNPFSMTGMREIARIFAQQLTSKHLDEALGTQVVKNLFYVGKCFCEIDLPAVSEATVGEFHDLEDDDTDAANVEEVDLTSNGHPLPWLFSRLSYQTRSAYIARRNRSRSESNWVHQPLSILRWFAAMISHISVAQATRFLVHILSPVYRIIEDDTIRDPQMEELKSLAIELQELVQAKVGTTEFSTVYNQIRQGLQGVRRERKTARVLLATTNPEAAAKRRLARNSNKKQSRKRKDALYMETKGKGPKSKRARVE